MGFKATQVMEDRYTCRIKYALGLRVDKTGNVYIADIASEVVRMVDTSGIIHTFAGNVIM